MGASIGNGISIGAGIKISVTELQAPIPLINPVISGTPQRNSVLTTSNGVWFGAPSNFSYSYQWLRDTSPITGETDSTYTLTNSDVGTDISVEVTATTVAGSTAAISAAATQILPQLPTVPSGLTLARPSANNTTLTLEASWVRPVDDGGEIDGYYIRNNLGNIVKDVVGDITSTSFTLAGTDRDTLFSYQIAAYNRAGVGPYTSLSTSIKSAPALGSEIDIPVGLNTVFYVGGGQCLALASTGTGYNGAVLAISNMSTPLIDGFNMPTIAQMQQFRAGGTVNLIFTYWTSDICAPNSRLTFNGQTGAQSCQLQSNISAGVGAGVGTILV